LKDLALARDAGAAIEALNSHITWTPRQLVAYAVRHAWATSMYGRRLWSETPSRA
jgi:hypothetical protein